MSHRHPGLGHALSADPRHRPDEPNGGWLCPGVTQRPRRKAPFTVGQQRLLDRQKSHDTQPPMADGSQFSAGKPKGIRPGSVNPRNH